MQRNQREPTGPEAIMLDEKSPEVAEWLQKQSRQTYKASLRQ